MILIRVKTHSLLRYKARKLNTIKILTMAQKVQTQTNKAQVHQDFNNNNNNNKT